MFRKGYKTWCERASINLRSQLGLRAFEPIDLQKVAVSLNADVKSPEQIPGLSTAVIKTLNQADSEWSAVTIKIKDRIVIVLNSAQSKARQMSSLAHELSHLIIGHAASKTGITPDGLLLNAFDREQEDEAGWLSGCILLPFDACMHIKKEKMTEAVAQKYYGVSSEMLKYRTNASGVSRLTRVYSKN